MAWQYLAVLTATVQAHAENDVDRRAIDALRRAVEVDPQNLDALLALGVSYTNELDQAMHTPARAQWHGTDSRQCSSVVDYTPINR